MLINDINELFGFITSYDRLLTRFGQLCNWSSSYIQSTYGRFYDIHCCMSSWSRGFMHSNFSILFAQSGPPVEMLFSTNIVPVPKRILEQVVTYTILHYYITTKLVLQCIISWVLKIFTDLLKASVSFSALKSRENAFPKKGIVVKRGPGCMFLNSYSTIR